MKWLQHNKGPSDLEQGVLQQMICSPKYWSNTLDLKSLTQIWSPQTHSGEFIKDYFLWWINPCLVLVTETFSALSEDSVTNSLYAILEKETWTRINSVWLRWRFIIIAYAGLHIFKTIFYYWIKCYCMEAKTKGNLLLLIRLHVNDTGLPSKTCEDAKETFI